MEVTDVILYCINNEGQKRPDIWRACFFLLRKHALHLCVNKYFKILKLCNKPLEQLFEVERFELLCIKEDHFSEEDYFLSFGSPLRCCQAQILLAVSILSLKHPAGLFSSSWTYSHCLCFLCPAAKEKKCRVPGWWLVMEPKEVFKTWFRPQKIAILKIRVILLESFRFLCKKKYKRVFTVTSGGCEKKKLFRQTEPYFVLVVTQSPDGYQQNIRHLPFLGLCAAHTLLAFSRSARCCTGVAITESGDRDHRSAASNSFSTSAPPTPPRG